MHPAESVGEERHDRAHVEATPSSPDLASTASATDRAPAIPSLADVQQRRTAFLADAPTATAGPPQTGHATRVRRTRLGQVEGHWAERGRGDTLAPRRGGGAPPRSRTTPSSASCCGRRIWSNGQLATSAPRCSTSPRTRTAARSAATRPAEKPRSDRDPGPSFPTGAVAPCAGRTTAPLDRLSTLVPNGGGRGWIQSRAGAPAPTRAGAPLRTWRRQARGPDPAVPGRRVLRGVAGPGEVERAIAEVDRHVRAHGRSRCMHGLDDVSGARCAVEVDGSSRSGCSLSDGCDQPVVPVVGQPTWCSKCSCTAFEHVTGELGPADDQVGEERIGLVVAQRTSVQS